MRLKFIAEIGLNHNGNFDLNFELIRQAKYSGANIVKFQLGWRGGETEMNFMNEERVDKLIKWCNYFEVEPMFSVFTEEAFLLLKGKNLQFYKIASRTVVDKPELVEMILNENKETFISLGMWDKPNFPFSEYNNVKYLWCKSVYPNTPWDMNNFPKVFNDSSYFGYSDHTIGIDSAILAISRGACVIEKHFTLDKSNTTIRDHALSATPSEFRSMVEIGSEIFKKIQLGV